MAFVVCYNGGLRVRSDAQVCGRHGNVFELAPRPVLRSADLTRMNAEESKGFQGYPEVDPVVPEAPRADFAAVTQEQYDNGRALSRLGWLAWWLELPLSMTTAAIVAFALVTKGSTASAAVSAGLVFAVAAVVTCLISIIVAWAYAAMGRRIMAGKKSFPASRLIWFGLFLAFIGIVLSLLGVQIIVGTTLGKALSSGLSSSNVVQSVSAVTAIDLLVIQGCVNALMSQFIAMTVAMNLYPRFNKAIAID
mmetsp:Transcript_20387/g.29582  ORF Transcript_20387/g.29582 Transcript_20387/m.29582 type:complete len:250 (-) Transcript_20387:116-865(-)|eukprot:CAMPEP_0184746078 /NCGR_PEP_ID=MMETSP0315-20130426/8640_1 /TAXON_ID=101924 /ORGANISM="Rhodosorus marinus, Strain UTEX LB 2760" /LENGTH=249 /DNA_ID=CAMNT_0027218463 /DNA_START=65 /DNA_END=814 /DNA_ORIENTATION=-